MRRTSTWPRALTEDVVANYTVTDEHGATATATLTITVNGVNDAPVAVDDSGSGNEDSTITGTVATNDSDVDDGASLSYAPTMCRRALPC